MKNKAYTASIRAIRTFAAAFLAQILVTNNTYSEQAILAAVAAGLTAVLNLATTPKS